MKYFVYSLAFMVIACTSQYKGMQQISSDQVCEENIKPGQIQTGWFKAGIDVMGKHISGLLLIKQMDEGSTRMVFTNEAGLTFFDFEFTANNDFKVHKIIKQMDKKAVINLLRQDFLLLLGLPFKGASYEVTTLNGEIFYGVKGKNETYYFITGKDCASLRRLEMGSNRKKKVTIVFTGAANSPDAVEVKHHTFDMVINLKKIEQE